MSDRLLDLLEDTARRRTADLPSTSDPVTRVVGAVRRDRRASASVAGAALSVVLVLAVVVGGVPRLTADPVVPATNDPEFPSVLRTVSFDGLAWPVAGSLATDGAFMSAVKLVIARGAAESQIESGGDQTSFNPTVLFAGDVGDRRVVVARDSSGNFWVADGLRGASAEDLVGSDRTYFVGSAQSPISVLMPHLGPGADLLVITPQGIGVKVASAPAVWPETDPAYRQTETGAGVVCRPSRGDATLRSHLGDGSRPRDRDRWQQRPRHRGRPRRP